MNAFNGWSTSRSSFKTGGNEQPESDGNLKLATTWREEHKMQFFAIFASLRLCVISRSWRVHFGGDLVPD